MLRSWETSDGRLVSLFPCGSLSFSLTISILPLPQACFPLSALLGKDLIEEKKLHISNDSAPKGLFQVKIN